MSRKTTHEVGPFFYIADAGRMDTRRANKPYATAEEAEKAARRRCKSGQGDTDIFFVPEGKTAWKATEYVATALKDPLDRVL